MNHSNNNDSESESVSSVGTSSKILVMSPEEGGAGALTITKDPMRDSLMSSSSDEGENEYSDDEDSENNNRTPVPGSFVDNSLDLELDLWQGQFEISRPPPRCYNGHAYYKEIVKTVGFVVHSCLFCSLAGVLCTDCTALAFKSQLVFLL